MKAVGSGVNGGRCLCIICCQPFSANRLQSAKRNAEVQNTLVRFGEHILCQQEGGTRKVKEQPRVPVGEEEDDPVSGQTLQPKKKKRGPRPKMRKKLALEDVMQVEEETEEEAYFSGDRIVELLDSCIIDDMTLCPDCSELMGSAAGVRAEACQLEKGVRRLQIVLLRQLKHLQNKMYAFNREMGRVKDILEEGDEGALLAKLNFEGSKKSKIMKPLFGKTAVNKWTVRRERVLRFRRSILQVAQKLEEHPVEPVEIDFGATVGDEEELGGDWEELDTGGDGSATTVKLETDYEEELVDHFDEHFYSDFDENGELSDIELKVEVEPADSVQMNGAIAENPGDSDPASKSPEDSEDEPEPAAQNRRKAATVARRKVKSFVRQEQKDDGGEDVEALVSDANDTDDDYEETLAKKATGRNLDVLFKKMSTFRREVVEKVIAKQQRAFHFRKKKLSRQRSVYQEQLLSLQFDAKRKCISLGGVLIEILDAEEKASTPENGIKCGQCGFVVLASSIPDHDQMSTAMYDHVIGIHLRAYKCSRCELILDSRLEFRNHLKHCVRVECPVCGKPLLSKTALDRHLWLHKSSEEKAEALAQGFKPHEHRKKTERDFQCGTCGNCFPSSTSLRVHEQTHLSREQRKITICPRCGKDFLPAGWSYHNRYSECAREAEPVPQELPVECPHCGKTCKNKWARKMHVKLCHSESSVLRPFTCAQCGKCFRRKEGLKKHEFMHTGLKPYKCTGCGKAFAENRNRRRHEKTACPNLDTKKNQGEMHQNPTQLASVAMTGVPNPSAHPLLNFHPFHAPCQTHQP